MEEDREEQDEKKIEEPKEDKNVQAVPLFSEATADFLMRSHSPEDAAAFFSGQEYSLQYLSHKLVFSSWDIYCDKFFRLILPVVFFALCDTLPILILMSSGNPIPVVLFSLLVLAPMQIAKNRFYIALLADNKSPFSNSLKVFSSLGFYLQSILTVSVFMFSLFCGISLMILPGYLFYIIFSLSLYFASDEGLGTKASFKMAFVASRGYRFFIGSVWLFYVVLQSMIPGIFSLEIGEGVINTGFVPHVWNIVGFLIFSLVVSPLTQIIITGVYLEAKMSVFRLVSRIFERMGHSGNITVKVITEEEKKKLENQLGHDDSNTDRSDK